VAVQPARAGRFAEHHGRTVGERVVGVVAVDAAAGVLDVTNRPSSADRKGLPSRPLPRTRERKSGLHDRSSLPIGRRSLEKTRTRRETKTKAWRSPSRPSPGSLFLRVVGDVGVGHLASERWKRRPGTLRHATLHRVRRSLNDERSLWRGLSRN